LFARLEDVERLGDEVALVAHILDRLIDRHVERRAIPAMVRGSDPEDGLGEQSCVRAVERAGASIGDG
jgi:hypothetical protein